MVRVRLIGGVTVVSTESALLISLPSRIALSGSTNAWFVIPIEMLVRLVAYCSMLVGAIISTRIVRLPPAGICPPLQLTTPEAWAQVNIPGPTVPSAALKKVTWAGRTSRTTTLKAGAAPVFVTVSV